jgi:3-hydroxybutyryl-CoA dehydrogenase
LNARTEETLNWAHNKIRSNLEDLVAWDVLTRDIVEPTMSRISTTTSLEETAEDVDLVVEAVFEDLELKQRLFRELDHLCPERTILASNTSSLMPSMLTSATEREDRVIVAHFMYPPHLMPLVEVVPAEGTSDETVDCVVDLIEALDKHPVLVQKEVVGFIVNRIQMALVHEALSIVDEGIASPQDVDLAVKESFGRRLAVAGPVEMIEIMDGWDQLLQVMNYILPHLNRSREAPSVITEMVKEGRLGAKKGSDGFYEWTPESAETWSKQLDRFLAGFLSSSNET